MLDDTTDEEEEETFTLTLSQAVAAVLAGGGETLAVTGTITDDDDPEVTVSFGHSAYTVAEGGAVEVTVSLSGDPEREVTILVDKTEDGASPDDYSGVPGSLRFVSGETSKSFTFTAKDDLIDDDGESVDLAFGTLPGGVTAGGVTGATVTITDDDTAGVSIEPTELTVTEGGSDAYTVVLDTQPTGEVTVTISGHDGTDVSVAPATLTFTADNWETPQTVTVSAVLDDDAVVDDAVTLRHAVSGAEEYQTVTADSVVVTITEDDTAGVNINPTALTVIEGDATGSGYTVVLTTRPGADVTVTVSGHTGTDITLSDDSLTFTAANWDAAQTVTVSASRDDDAAQDQAVTLSHAVSSAGDALYNGIISDSVTVTITEDDTAGVTIAPTELTVTEGDPSGASYTVVLDTQPSAEVTIAIGGHDGTDITLSDTTLTFTAANWETPQTVTVNAAEDADALVDDSVTLSHTVSSVDDEGYNSMTADSVTITITEDDTAGVSIAPASLTVAEGGSNTYTVVLDSQPTGDVTVTISGHEVSDLSVSPATLTFTAANWNVAQTVTVSAEQDDDAATDEAVTLNHAVSSVDEADYNSVTADSVSVTITEDDTAAVRIEPTDLTVLEGSNNSYAVVLDSQPTSEVSIAISGHAGTAITLSDTMLTFTADNWETPQTVTVNAAQDHDAAADEAVTLSHTVSGTGEYASVTAESVVVTVTEDDTAGVSINPTELTVVEGGSDVYTVVLDTRPSADVTVTVSGHAGTDITLSDDSLTFTSENWGTPQTVAVTANQDQDATADEAVTLSHVVTGTGEYATVTADSVTVTTTEDDTAGVSIDLTELTVTEGDPSGTSYTVVLDTQPTGDVTVTISGHAGSDVSVDKTALTFTPGNWDVAQTVTVTAAQDGDAAPDQAVTLSHGVAGAEEYAAVTAASVTVTITEDDTAGVSIEPTELTVAEGGSASYTVALDSQPTAEVTIDISGHDGTDVSVDRSTLTFTADNWETPQTVTVSVVQDDDAAQDQAVTLSHAVGGTEEYQGVTAASVTVTITEADTAGVTINPTALTVPEGGNSSYTIVLTIRPTADVTVTISGDDGTDVSLSSTTLTFTAENWNQPQTVTVTANEDNDAVTDAQVTLSHAIGGAEEYQGVTTASVTVTITEKDSAGVTVNPTTLTVTEGDATGADYTVVLTTQPSTDVTVTISGHDGTDVAVAPSTLTFTSSNWDVAQTVTVSAAPDDDAAQDQAVTLAHAVTGTGEYQGITADSVTVTIEEEDTAGVSIDPTALTVPEGQTQDYTVVLTTQPSANVTVTISGHAGTDIILSNDSLTFTADNWETPQTVTITAGQDDDATADDIVTLSHAVTGTGEYRTVAAESVTVTITETDNAGVSIAPASLTVDEGGSASYTVVLDTQPTADVTVTISGHDGTEVSVDPSTLTFTATDWNVAQTVTVSAASDDDAVVDDTVTLSHAVSSVNDTEYNNVTAVSVTVTTTEADTAGVSISPTTLTVAEGGGTSYTVVLDTQPTGDVTVTISGHDGSDVSLDKTTLTFTAANWDTSQTVTVNAAPDDDAAADEVVALNHAVSGGGEYSSVTAESVTVTITEKDNAGVSIDPTTLTVTEGGSGIYTVVLDSQPIGEVRVDISGHADTDINLSDTTLTFTSENWETPQTVTVRAALDDDAVPDQAVTLNHAVSGSGEYAAITAESVTVTITEDDSAGVNIDPTVLTVVEGGSSSYAVLLTTRPSADVTVTISGHDGSDITVSDTTLTFTSDNWDVEQDGHRKRRARRRRGGGPGRNSEPHRQWDRRVRVGHCCQRRIYHS